MGGTTHAHKLPQAAISAIDPVCPVPVLNQAHGSAEHKVRGVVVGLHFLGGVIRPCGDLTLRHSNDFLLRVSDQLAQVPARRSHGALLVRARSSKEVHQNEGLFHGGATGDRPMILQQYGLVHRTQAFGDAIALPKVHRSSLKRVVRKATAGEGQGLLRQHQQSALLHRDRCSVRMVAVPHAMEVFTMCMNCRVDNEALHEQRASSCALVNDLPVNPDLEQGASSDLAEVKPERVDQEMGSVLQLL
mmetsp:Transcript_35225/g.77089  ORF Transcript_35225/g.77089 Transcript_35225/m.77089 type:complete len:246 (-) Transcript_35225:290-1027(-)|eukprot:CAMPEP_0204410392 /NCGR_PEP_ID=MMETSP0470-20130426/10709_1 /ASSEMBLY_ACC=CAM_ASM_000385 /TAXON_ID=2969 /ORGANISM="Oxyrrhis marina" /LENGTH=245 /DNA_ID=CAMNT_0051406291 /DNA_START=47 /DNA_END=784 /DNA_ORIENTATION=+